MLLKSGQFPVGGGRAGDAIRTRDWSTHQLGPAEHWPAALKVALGMILNSPESMFVAWGPDLNFFYNDAYEPALGPRRERAMGTPFAEVWSDVWADVIGLVDKALAGEASRFVDFPLMVNRSGAEEQSWWSFFYAPLYDENGVVAGMFCVTNETTERVKADLAQRASERQLRTIADALPVLIAYMDLDLRFMFANRGWETWLGRSQQEIIGWRPDKLLGDEFSEAGMSAINRARDGEHVVFDHWLSSVFGPRECEIQLIPRFNAADEVEGILVLTIDVSERKAGAEALRVSEQRFRGIAEAIPGFIWTANADGAIDYSSSRWHAYTGGTLESSKGIGWTRFLHPGDVERTEAAWKHSIATGTMFDIEYRLHGVDPRYRWWLCRALPVRRMDGVVDHWIGFCTDLQEIIEARETLARSHDELEREVARRTHERDRVWNNSRDLMLIVDRDGIFRAVSPSWTRTLGHKVDEVIGRSFRDFIHPDDVETTVTRLNGILRRDPLNAYVNCYLHKDGSPRWISWDSSMEDGMVYTYGRDITSEREKEQALAQAEDQLRQAQKMEAVGQLTGGIAHDFNNLLMGVIGSLEMTQRYIQSGRSAEIERFLNTAATSANRAAALTQRLLAFSRRQPLNPKRVDVNMLIADMAQLLERTLGAAINVAFMRGDDLWPTLCDPHQLENSILNLVINARDAMPQGGRLTIETCNKYLDASYAARNGEVAAGAYVCISITDTGEGMPAEIIERVFEPFFTTKPVGQGTGLGLSMVYGFTRQSGGHAKIYSEAGRGTTVKIYLPHDDGPAELQDQLSAKAAPPHAASGSTVLVIEDDPSVRALVIEVLADLQYAVLEAATGAEGLALLKTGTRVDLLLTDVGLPDLNGRQVAQAARGLRPDLNVLFMTGYADKAAFDGGFLDAGMDMVSKPFTIDVLSQKIREILQR